MLVDCATFSTLSLFIKGVIRERGRTREGKKERRERERETEKEKKRKREREREKERKRNRGCWGFTSAGHGGANGSITLSIMPTTFQNQGHLRLIPHALTVSDVCLMR